jgi:hypothetical protein
MMHSHKGPRYTRYYAQTTVLTDLSKKHFYAMQAREKYLRKREEECVPEK